MKLGSSNDAQAVKAQYARSDRLNTRISFHDAYSTNPQGLGSWMASHYTFPDGARVLELGCGTGSLWRGQGALIERCAELVLSDLSPGMLETARETVGARANISYRQADIQALPFGASSFDVVIANFMLYHVPELAKGVAEVRRVLKPDGVFYCATYGEHNFVECLAQWLSLGGESFTPNHNFTLQNGASILSASFGRVEAFFYEDSLRVTRAEDLLLYLRSMASLHAADRFPDEMVLNVLHSHEENGVIELPKEYGMFAARGYAAP